LTYCPKNYNCLQINDQKSFCTHHKDGFLKESEPILAIIYCEEQRRGNFTKYMFSHFNKIDWQKELELFLQADLNKQSYQLSYNKEETPKMVVYMLKEGESLPVKSLKIIFDEDKSVKHIEALIQTENYLYKSEKYLLMTLDKNHLTHYQIEGWQELFIGKKKNFKVDGIVVRK
jgi:hypothetical protein